MSEVKVKSIFLTKTFTTGWMEMVSNLLLVFAMMEGILSPTAFAIGVAVLKAIHIVAVFFVRLATDKPARVTFKNVKY